MSDDENLARRRPRRSTAGNRMQAALAEVPAGDGNYEMDDDGDFLNDKEEDDIFESDFESTDEEATQTEIFSGEKEVQDEERRAIKRTKSKLEKITAAADARLRVTFNPDDMSKGKVYTKQKPRRRVSLGLTINAETGEVIAADSAAAADMMDGNPPLVQPKTRQSQRKHTIQNTVETVKRLKSSEEKKATTPKKVRTVEKLYTQDELLSRALDNEEGNLVEHRDYLQLEEEKRKRAKVIKTAVEGPLVRWVSRLEQVHVTSQLPLPSTSGSSSITFPSSPITHSASSLAHSSHILQSGVSNQATANAAQTHPSLPQQLVQPIASPPASSINLQHQPQPMASPLAHSTILAPTTPTPTAMDTTIGAEHLAQTQPVMKKETVGKSYVIHELGQRDGIRKPTWAETMRDMFGDHVRWDEVRVYVGKGRPLSRPRHICPITGKQASYMDPRTGVPYADVGAFRVLTGLLEHEYIWNAELGCYVGQEEAEGM